MELVIAAVVLGRISMFSGLKTQEDWSGRPEQESVTNIGAVSAEAFSGAMEAVMVPELPGMRVSVAGEMEIWKLGVVESSPWTLAEGETEARWVVSPA